MLKHLLPLVFGIAGTAALMLPAQAADTPSSQCFFADQVAGWRAPDRKTIYIRVNSDRYYRLSLASDCITITSPGARLAFRAHGKNTVCTAQDWDIGASQVQSNTGPEQCVVQSMTAMDADAVAAIPKAFKP